MRLRMGGEGGVRVGRHRVGDDRQQRNVVLRIAVESAAREAVQRLAQRGQPCVRVGHLAGAERRCADQLAGDGAIGQDVASLA